MVKAGLEARKAAVRAMTLVTDEGRLLSEALPQVSEGLPPSDRARLGRLATGALRWAGRSDRLLGPHLRLKPEDPVLNALRLAIYEIFAEGAPEHAAVDAAVSMTSRSKQGLVNGVMRNLLRRQPDWNAMPVPGVPKWLRKRLVAAWGKEALAGMEQKAAIYTDAYDQLLRKVEGAERAEDLYRAQQGAKVKILDNARPPLEATSRRIQIGLAGLIGALLAGVGVGFLLEWRDPVISTLEGVEGAAGVPVFGTIPRIN